MDLNWAVSILYKLAAVSAGTFIVYLGYKLFIKGVYGDTGEVSLDWNNNKVLLKRAAPGSIFAIFGALVVAVTVRTPAVYSPSIYSSSGGISAITGPQIYSPSGSLSTISLFGIDQTANVQKLKQLIETGNLDDASKKILEEVIMTMNREGSIRVQNDPNDSM